MRPDGSNAPPARPAPALSKVRRDIGPASPPPNLPIAIRIPPKSVMNAVRTAAHGRPHAYDDMSQHAQIRTLLQGYRRSTFVQWPPPWPAPRPRSSPRFAAAGEQPEAHSGQPKRKRIGGDPLDDPGAEPEIDADRQGREPRQANQAKTQREKPDGARRPLLTQQRRADERRARIRQKKVLRGAEIMPARRGVF